MKPIAFALLILLSAGAPQYVSAADQPIQDVDVPNVNMRKTRPNAVPAVLAVPEHQLQDAESRHAKLITAPEHAGNNAIPSYNVNTVGSKKGIHPDETKAAGSSAKKLITAPEDAGNSAFPSNRVNTAATKKGNHPSGLAGTAKGHAAVLPKPTAVPRKQTQAQLPATVAINASPGPAANLHPIPPPRPSGLNAPASVQPPKIQAQASATSAQLPIILVQTPSATLVNQATKAVRSTQSLGGVGGAISHRPVNPAVIGGAVTVPAKKNAGPQGMVALGRL